MLCAVTMSYAALARNPELPRNVAYINPVQTFSTAAEFYKARLNTIRRIPTDAFFFQDYDDTCPNQYLHPKGGIISGDSRVVLADQGRLLYQPRKPWTAEQHLADPFGFVRRAICDTQRSLRISEQLPQEGEYYLDFLLYYLLARRFGSQHHAGLEMVWRKRPTGMHTRCVVAVRNSVQWLLENESKVLDALQ